MSMSANSEAGLFHVYDNAQDDDGEEMNIGFLEKSFPTLEEALLVISTAFIAYFLIASLLTSRLF